MKDIVLFPDVEIGKVFTFEYGHGVKYKKISADRAVNLKYVTCAIINPSAKCVVFDDNVTVDIRTAPLNTYATLTQGEYFEIDDVAYLKLASYALRMHDLEVVHIKGTTNINHVELVSAASQMSV